MKVEKYLKLKEFVKKTVSEVLNEQFETSMIKAPSTIVQSDLLVEMSRINKNEQGNSIFPYNSFEVQVWSNDHNPPHFDVLSNGCQTEILFNQNQPIKKLH